MTSAAGDIAPHVAAPSLSALAAGLATGSVGLLMLGLQPLLLGTLADEGRLSVGGIGAAATVELLTLGVTTGVLCAVAPPVGLRWANGLAALALAATNAWGMVATQGWLVASRGAAGIASGVLVWIAVSLIIRAARPDRASGIFLTAQTIAQAILAALLPLTLMRFYGARGGLACLGVLALASIAFSALLPRRLAALPPQEGHGAMPPGMALVGLASVFLWLAGVVGLWVFVEQIGSLDRISAAIAGAAVAVALTAQVGGSLSATVLSGRVPTLAVLCVAGLVNVAVTQVLALQIGPAAYLASIVVFGFLWMFALPFQTALLIDLDPSRRAALLLSPAQLLGSAAGPMVTSAFALKDSLHAALLADAGLFLVAVVLLGIVWVRPRQQAVLF